MHSSSLIRSEVPSLTTVEWLAVPARPLDPRLLLAGILGVLVILGGLLSSWGIKRIDQHYSSLVKVTAQDLDSLHDISYHSGIGCAAALQLANTSDSAARSALMQAIADERSANDQVFGQLRRNTTDPRLRDGLERVIALRVVFNSRTDDFVRAHLTASFDSQSSLNNSAMLAAFTQYQTACAHLVDLIRSNSMESSSQLAHEVVGFRLIFLAAGALPVLLGFAAILATLYYAVRTPLEVDLKE